MNANQPYFNGFQSLRDVEAFSDDLLKAMDDLTDVIEAETDLVRAGQLLSATALQPRKSQHAESYIKLVECARNQAQTIKDISPKVAEQLIRAQDIFKATLQINMAALTTAREVSQSLIKGVADNMARQEKPSTYTASAGQSVAHNAPATGIAVNRSL
jgi:hypothetical protein